MALTTLALVSFWFYKFVIIFASVLVFILTLLLLLSISVRRDRRRCNINGPGPLPVIGNGVVFFGGSTCYLTHLGYLAHVYKTATQIFMMHRRFVIFWDAKIIEPLLTMTEPTYKSDLYRFPKQWFGHLASAECKNRNKFVNLNLHNAFLQTFLPVYVRNSSILTDTLRSLADGRTIDVFPIFSFAALDNLIETALGDSIEAQKCSKSKCVIAIEKISDVMTRRSTNAFLGNEFIFRCHPLNISLKKSLAIIDGHIGNVVAKRLNYLKKSSISGIESENNLLDYMLQSEMDGPKFNIEIICEEVKNFIFERYDVITSAVSFIIYCLAQNPKVQEKIYEEQLNLFEDDLHRSPSENDLQEMKYLDLVIKESLRIYPPVPLITRKLINYVEIEGYRIPKDTTVILDIFHMQRFSSFFESPLQFKPERFMSSQRHFNSFISFSAGFKNKIGEDLTLMEIKVFITSIIRNFTILPTEVEPILGAEIVLRPKNGIHVKLLPRQRS